MCFRMIGVALRLAGPYLLTPWKSPLLRWRIETYGCGDSRGHLLHADALTPAQCVRFTVQHRQAICRFLRWAACL